MKEPMQTGISASLPLKNLSMNIRQTPCLCTPFVYNILQQVRYAEDGSIALLLRGQLLCANAFSRGIEVFI